MTLFLLGVAFVVFTGLVLLMLYLMHECTHHSYRETSDTLIFIGALLGFLAFSILDVLVFFEILNKLFL